MMELLYGDCISSVYLLYSYSGGVVGHHWTHSLLIPCWLLSWSLDRMCLSVTNSIFWAQQGLWSAPVRVQCCDHHTSVSCAWVTPLGFWEVKSRGTFCSTGCTYLSIFQGAWGIHLPFSSWWGAVLHLIQDTFRSGLHRKTCECSSMALHQSQCQTGHAAVQPQLWGFLFQCPLPNNQFFWLLAGHSHYRTALSWFCSCPWPSQLSAVLALINCFLEWMCWWVSCPCWYQSSWVISSQCGTCHFSNSKEMLRPESTLSKWLVLNKTFLCRTEMV